MAGVETYRIEIPIIVNDQTEAPISNVGKRLSKMEQSALKVNNNIRKIFGREISLRIGAIDKAWPVIRSVQTRLRGLTGKVWNVTLKAKDGITNTVKSIISKLTSPLALLGAGAGLGAGIIFPLKLAGEMEQAGIAMEFFTESAEKGQAFMKRLQEFAAKTPFEFPDVRDAAVGLMPLYKNIYGVDKAMEETMRTIAAFGDAAGLTGAGIQGMNLAMLGFRQIGTIGKLSMEELRQVTENLMIPMSIILDELGLTGDALDNLAKEGIESRIAMEGIVRALEKNFAGGMDKMSRSLLGLTSTIKDTATLTVWHFGAGMAEPVRRIFLDIVGLTDDTGGKFEEFQRKLEHVGRRVGRKFEEMYGEAKRFFRELADIPGFDKLPWDEKIAIILDRVIETMEEWSKNTRIFEVGTKVGATLGSGFAKGLGRAISDDAQTALFFGLISGAFAPGPWQFKVAIAVSIIAAPWVKKVLEWIAAGGEAVGRHMPGSAYYTQERVEEYLVEYEKTEQLLRKQQGGFGGFRALENSAGPRPVFEGQSLSARPAFAGQSLSAKAIGGIVNYPVIAGEAGPEAIIPLSARMRARALALYEEAGRHLGVRPYAIGGFAGPVPVGVPTMAGAAPNVILNFDFADLVRQVTINNHSDIDDAVDKIADTLRSAFQNMVIKR